MKFYIFILVLILSACASTENEQNKPQQENGVTTTPETQSVYFFQHRILPDWTFNSEGLFYDDLVNGDLAELRRAAADIVSEDYSSKVASQALPDKNAVLITFPEPKGLTHCYFVLIVKRESHYAFYTYEKTMQFGEEDQVKGVVGTWTRDGSHGNLGPRMYTSAEKFIEDVLGERR